MRRIESVVTGQLADLLRADDGIPAACANLIGPGEADIPSLTGGAVLEQFIAADLAEKAANTRYPVMHVYCDRVVNKLTEKFRRFSGTATLNIDIRVSHDHVSELQKQLQVYVESVTQVLQSRRGDWGSGVFYTGGYEIVFHPVKRGGRNYIQSALVRLEVNISAD